MVDHQGDEKLVEDPVSNAELLPTLRHPLCDQAKGADLLRNSAVCPWCSAMSARIHRRVQEDGDGPEGPDDGDPKK
eukprot:5393402-Amphidinium_carterae.1